MAGRWLFTKEQLSKTPSIKHGYSEEMEGAYRTNCANLIQNMGQRLQLYPFHNENFEPFKLEKKKLMKKKEGKQERKNRIYNETNESVGLFLHLV